jgi:hypothetical protein
LLGPHAPRGLLRVPGCHGLPPGLVLPPRFILLLGTAIDRAWGRWWGRCGGGLGTA